MQTGNNHNRKREETIVKGRFFLLMGIIRVVDHGRCIFSGLGIEIGKGGT